MSFGKKSYKYFTGYKDDEKVKPFCIMLPKMSRYIKRFDETKYMSSLIKDGKLLKNYNKILELVSSSIIKGFDSKLPVCNEKYWKTNVKYYEGKINTNCHNNGIPMEGCHGVCLSVILIDSVFKMGKNYYPRVFLEELKNIVKKKKKKDKHVY